MVTGVTGAGQGTETLIGAEVRKGTGGVAGHATQIWIRVAGTEALQQAAALQQLHACLIPHKLVGVGRGRQAVQLG